MKQDSYETSQVRPLEHKAMANIQASRPDKLKVVLICPDEKELIKDVPLKYDGSNVLLVPILDHIKKLGKPIVSHSISYYSEEDEMDVFVGIEGKSIPLDYSIPISELKIGSQFKLTLRIKKPQDNGKLQNGAEVKTEVSEQPPAPQETQNIAVSLPNLATESQMENVINGIN